MNTTDNNKLIAEFLEFKKLSEHIYSSQNILFSIEEETNWFVDDLKFHTDWNWLMEVVDKIESEGFIFKIHGNEATFLKKGTFNKLIWNDSFIGFNRIGATYNACVEFIKWFNQQK